VSFGKTKEDQIARRALLDALQALEPHLKSLVLIGAQAVYLRTDSVALAVAPYTTDADLMIDSRGLAPSPEITSLLKSVGFWSSTELGGNPGHWINADGTPLDLMQPRIQSTRGKNARSASLPPHDSTTARIADGLDCALIDSDALLIDAFDNNDSRSFQCRVAGPAALIVAKVFKISDRQNQKQSRMVNKDALDVFRLLKASDPKELAGRFQLLLNHELSSAEANRGLELFETLFAQEVNAFGNELIANAFQGLEPVDLMKEQAMALASELVGALR
jgi:hypothetical protein